MKEHTKSGLFEGARVRSNDILRTKFTKSTTESRKKKKNISGHLHHELGWSGWNKCSPDL